MKKYSLILAGLCLWSLQLLAQSGTTSLVSVGPDGRLQYTPDAKGNVIPDFSAVGYKSGEESIPNVPVVKTISAVSGDNTSNIQNAINAVASMPMDANGIRGALLLKAGTYNINNTLNIKSGGVIIRGEGNATILMATKTSQYNLISVSGSGGVSANTSTSQKIQGSYIPVGAKTFTLPANHGFKTGDDVILQRKPNQAWINMLGMNVLSQIPCDDGGCNVDWTPSAYTVNYIRKVVAVNGNNVTLDAPNVDVIDSKYAEGFIMKYSWSGKIENVGVESLYFDSKYTNANDENHGWNAVSFSNSKNCWVTNIEAHHFGYSAVSVNESAAFTSILNSKNLDPISQTIGGRKYSFNITGQRNLVKNCSTRGGRHDYVTGAQTAGPNVFVNSSASNQQADIGPHQRWATGILFDVLTGNGQMNAQNRLGYGTGHGWSGAQVVYWNCSAAKFMVQSPPNHMNWVIGSKGTVTDVGDLYTGSPCISQSIGNFIGAIPSLYEKQLADRLGTIQNPVPDNLAKGKPVTVSSTESNNTVSTDGANATDGNYYTRWSSLFADPQWLSVDLGANYLINRVKLTWEAAYAKDYKVQVSEDGNQWSDLKTIAGNNSATNDLTGLSGAGRYVRIYGTARATTYGYSLYELEVYGTPGAPICQPVAASSDDGNVATNVLDNNLSTRWSANGDGQWILFCLDTPKEVNGAQIAFYSGDTRQSTFDIVVSTDGLQWNTVLTGAKSSGTSLNLETFSFTAHQAKYVKIVGHGNSVNTWNSFTEVVILSGTNQAPTVTLTAPLTGSSFDAPANITLSATASDTDGSIAKVEFYNGDVLLGSTNTAPYTFSWTNVNAGTYSIVAKATDNIGSQTSSSAITLTVNSVAPSCQPVIASGDDGNIPSNVLDNNLSTRWSADGDGQWIQFCLDTPKDVYGVGIAFYNGNTRQSTFDVALSTDGSHWTNALTASKSSGTSLNIENFTFATQQAKYVKITGHGNSTNTWNSFTEVSILTGTAPVNKAPIVTLTAPAANSAYNTPASITITANANDSDGSIVKVEFYNGSTLLGSDNTSPYTYTWTNVSAGSYTLTAKATDNEGTTTTSTSSTVTVHTIVVSNPCSGIATYKENGGYSAGSKVQNSGKQYQCKPYPYSGWCNGAAWAYAPGSGAYWTDAWTLIGSCSARNSDESSVNEVLLTNAPNPFSSVTTLTVTVTESGNVSLQLFSKTGQPVKTIAEGYLNVGTYEFNVDGTELPADVYLVKYTSDAASLIRKIVKTE